MNQDGKGDSDNRIRAHLEAIAIEIMGSWGRTYFQCRVNISVPRRCHEQMAGTTK